MLLTLYGTMKPGDLIERKGETFRVESVISTEEKYELDGITYDEWPEEGPDREWVESTVEATLLEPVEVAAIAEAKAQLAAIEGACGSGGDNKQKRFGHLKIVNFRISWMVNIP